MFVFQLSACIAGYALKGNTIALVNLQLAETMDLYGLGENKNFEVTKLWDIVQENVSIYSISIFINVVLNRNISMIINIFTDIE